MLELRLASSEALMGSAGVYAEILFHSYGFHVLREISEHVPQKDVLLANFLLLLQCARVISVTEIPVPVAVVTHSMMHRERMITGHNTMCHLPSGDPLLPLLEAARSATGLKKMLEKYCTTH